MDATIKLEDKANLKITASIVLGMAGARIIFLLAFVATGHCHLSQLLNGFTAGLKVGGIGGSGSENNDAIVYDGPSHNSGSSGSYSGSGSYSQSSAASFASSNSGSYSFGGSTNPTSGNLVHSGGVASAGAGGANNGLFGISSSIGIVPQKPSSSYNTGFVAGQTIGSLPNAFGGSLILGSSHNTGSSSGAYAGASAGSGSHGSLLINQQTESKFPASGSYVGSGASNVYQGQSGGSGTLFTMGVSSGVNDASKYNTVGGSIYGSSTGASGSKTDSYGNPVSNEYFESHITAKPNSFSVQEKVEHETYKIPSNVQSSNIGGSLTFGSSYGASGSATNNKVASGSTTYNTVPSHSTTQQPSKLIVSAPAKPQYTETANVDYYPAKQPNFQASINMGTSGSGAGSYSGSQSNSGVISSGTIGINKTPIYSTTQQPSKLIASVESKPHYTEPSNVDYFPSKQPNLGASFNMGTAGSQAGSSSGSVSGSYGQYSGTFGGAPGILGEQKPGYAIKETHKITAAPGYHVTMSLGSGSGSYGGSNSYAGSGSGSYGGNVNVGSSPKPNTTPSKYVGGFGGSVGILGEQQQPGYAVQVTNNKDYAPNVGYTTTTTTNGGVSHSHASGMKYTGSFGGAPGIITATGPATNYHKPSGSVILAGGFISGNTTPKPIGVSGTHTMIYADKKSDYYGGSFGGAPGIISATGPATNYPSGGVSMNGSFGSQSGSIGHGGHTGHVIVMDVKKPNTVYPAVNVGSVHSGSTGGVIMSGHVGSVPTTGNVIGIDIRGPQTGVYNYQASHSSAASASSSSAASGSLSYGGSGSYGAGYGGNHGGSGSHHIGVHGVKTSGGLMGGLVNGMLGGLSDVKSGILGGSIGGSIGAGSHASASSGAYSGGNYGKEFKFSIG